MKEAEKIANLLLSAQWELLWPTLLTVFIAIVGVYIYSITKKSGELKAINSNFTTVLQQQEQLVKQSEDIRHALAKDSIFYEIQVRSYKEKSVESIDTVYRVLLELKKAAQDTSFPINKEKRSNFIESVSSFNDTFELHRIWLPHNLADKIEGLATEINIRWNKYIIACNRLDSHQFRSGPQTDKLCDIQEQFTDYIHSEIHDIFKDLAKEIANEFGART